MQALVNEGDLVVDVGALFLARGVDSYPWESSLSRSMLKKLHQLKDMPVYSFVEVVSQSRFRHAIISDL